MTTIPRSCKLHLETWTIMDLRLRISFSPCCYMARHLWDFKLGDPFPNGCPSHASTFGVSASGFWITALCMGANDA